MGSSLHGHVSMMITRHQSFDDKTHVICQRQDSIVKSNRTRVSAPDRITRKYVKTVGHEKERPGTGTVRAFNTVENSFIMYVDDPTKQLKETKITLTYSIYDISDESRTGEISEYRHTETFDSKLCNPSDGVSYGERLRDADSLACSLNFEPKDDTDNQFTEETHLKMVYDPACEPDTGLHT